MDSSTSERARSLEAPMGEKRKVVRVWLFGGFRVSVGSRTIPPDSWRLRKAAALVKLLALAPGHRLHREQIIDLLWPGSGRKSASNNLRRVLHGTRRVLDPTAGSRYLASEDESLVLCPESDLWVDAEAFEEAAVTARRGKDPAAYRAAIDLYVGLLLPEDRYKEWAESRRGELRRLYLELLVELAGLYEERGEYERSIEALQRVVAEEPTLEEAHAGLIRIHALSGRRREALAQYERLRNILVRDLGTEPDAATRSLREEIAAGRLPSAHTTAAGFPPQGPTDAERHNLPAPRTSFVGREREMLEVKRALSMTRLLTLTGVGGSGKTRLALEVARDLMGSYPDGVWLVEVAGLSEGALVPQAVAGALGIREQPGQPLTDTLVDALRAKNVLLVLDNCEHLVGTTAHLTDTLLDACPRLRVLATSRESLDVAGEVKWPVRSLSVPDPHRSYAVTELEGSAAVRLFAERARQRDPIFALTSGNVQSVAEICRRLEGIPLAIELVAARVETLSAEQILKRLMDSLKLLTSGDRTAALRQRTMQGALDWSLDLLSEPERLLFGRLSSSQEDVRWRRRR
jgi:DNA-binding SARP family transcriptional activator